MKLSVAVIIKKKIKYLHSALQLTFAQQQVAQLPFHQQCRRQSTFIDFFCSVKLLCLVGVAVGIAASAGSACIFAL